MLKGILLLSLCVAVLAADESQPQLQPGSKLASEPQTQFQTGLRKRVARQVEMPEGTGSIPDRFTGVMKKAGDSVNGMVEAGMQEAGKLMDKFGSMVGGRRRRAAQADSIPPPPPPPPSSPPSDFQPPAPAR